MNQPILITNIKKFEDNRGIFYESYKENSLDKEYGITKKFVQDNHSISKYGVIRGMHYQWDKPMDKLVRVSKGIIIDIILDIRKNSKTFGEINTYILDEENNNQLWVPAGFAHAFISLSTESHVQYKCTELYNKDGESGITPFDKDIKPYFLKYISEEKIIISDKDRSAKTFYEYILDPKF